TLRPPVLITSSARPSTVRAPSSSIVARSEVVKERRGAEAPSGRSRRMPLPEGEEVDGPAKEEVSASPSAGRYPVARVGEEMTRRTAPSASGDCRRRWTPGRQRRSEPQPPAVAEGP